MSVLYRCDCLEYLRKLPDNSVDLVFCSPPYETARTYGIGFCLKGQDWVDWCVERYVECVRVCKGLVAWVVEGQTRQFRWSATPVLLMADLHRAGVRLRKPPIFNRIGIPGSGGPDWLRNDYEFVVCATKGKLPWSDNTAMGHPPRWAPGGAMSNRQVDGRRMNVVKPWGEGGDMPETRSGDAVRRPQKVQTRRKANEERLRDGVYEMPVLANPGNIVKCKVGGGLMGSKIAHENEAPFPEKLVEPFVRSFCPPGGLVLDIFCGSGTTGAVAIRTGRRFIGVDIRESEIEKTSRRLKEIQPELIA